MHWSLIIEVTNIVSLIFYPNDTILRRNNFFNKTRRHARTLSLPFPHPIIGAQSPTQAIFP
jgi:hypothetical protein